MDGQAVLPDHGPTAPAAPSLGKQASLPERPDQPLSSPHPRFPTSSEAAFSPGQLNLPPAHGPDQTWGSGGEHGFRAVGDGVRQAGGEVG